MNETMEKQLLIIQIAQLKDENSDLQKSCTQLQSDLDNVISGRDKEIAKVQLECKEEMAAYENATEKKTAAIFENAKIFVSQALASSKKELESKDRELSRMRESKDQVISTEQKTIRDLSDKYENMKAASVKSISRNLWYRQQHWGSSTEQARLLQNRNPLTRKEEKSLYQMNLPRDEFETDTSELDTSRRKAKKNKHLRLDYRKNQAYTKAPIRIHLEDYLVLKEGEHLKKRNGVVEKRTKRIVRMIPAHFEEIFIEIATVRKGYEERDSYIIEDMVIPGVPFDAEMISFILSEHYCYNTTWANISRKLDQYGIHINDSTLGDIAHRCISYMKSKMQEVWMNELYRTNYWMIDETTGIIGLVDKQSGVRKYLTKYMWGIRANKLKLVWFIYEEGSRGAKVIKPFLDKFKGYFTTDGYIVYKMFEGILNAEQIRSACLTHIRRGLVEALHENRHLISWFLNRIKKLFEIEADCKDMGLTGEKRLLKRICRSRSIMQDIEKKFKLYIERGLSKLGVMTQSALNYISHEWEAMKNILKNGDIEISNNLCEQMMRHVKINLKNSQNIGSEKCAKNFCFMYSLVESCSSNKLSPAKYISYLLNNLKKQVRPEDRRDLLPCYCNI